jgi:DNA repair exonuclease SbcCD ATPase subunit
LIYLQELRLTNHVVFKRLRWRLDQHPLTVIRGLNRDRGSSSNAVGKSLLGASIANLITDAPPISIRKHSAKELVFGKGRVELDLRNDKIAWSLQQFAKGKTVRYDIMRNGKSMAAKDIKQARKFIHDAVPLSDEQFYSQVLISSYRPSILLYGRANARLELFEEIFDLRVYDMMRKSLLQDLSQINHKFSQAELLNKQREELQPQLRRDLATDIEKIRQRHKRLLQHYRRANQQAQELIAYTTLAEQLSSNATLTELQSQAKQISTKLRRNNQRYIKLHRAFGAARSNQKILRTRRLLQRRLAAIPKITNHHKLSRFMLRADSHITQLQDNIRQYLDYERYIDKYREIINSVNLADQRDPAGLQRQLTETEHSLAQQRALRSGKPCPVCGKIVERRRHRHTLRQLRDNARLVSNQLKRVKRVQFCLKLQAKLPKSVLNMSINTTRNKLRNLEQQLDQAQQRTATVEQRRQINNQLKQLPEVHVIRPINRTRLRLLEQRINKLTRQQERLTNDIQLLHKIAELNTEYDNHRNAKLTLRAVQQVIDQISPRLQSVSDKMHRFTAQQSEYNAARRQLHQITEELSEIETVIKNKDIVEALVQAYSTRGIRLMQIQSLANTYVAGLNALASSIYSEPMKFFAEVSPNQFNILVQRHGKISDIRALSGSESRQFLVISALAMVKLMPNHMRVNTIILDEMEAGLSRQDRLLFCQQFVPLLTNSIPHTVIITPHDDTELPIINAHEMTLERKNGVSKWTT